MRNITNSPSPSQRRVGSPSYVPRPGSPSEAHYSSSNAIFRVSPGKSSFLSILLFCDVVLLPFAIKKNILFLPLVALVVLTILVYSTINQEATLIAQRIKKSMTPDSISSLLRNTDNPVIDYHVRAKLIEEMKNGN